MAEEVTLELFAPLLFDESIGLWTEEPDMAALHRALAAVPEHPEVERILGEAGVLLRGPEEAVRVEGALLREAGLE